MESKNLHTGAAKVALFPPMHHWSELGAALGAYREHALVPIMLKRLSSQETKAKKTIAEIIRESEKSEQSAVGAPKVALKDFTSALTRSSRALESLLEGTIGRQEVKKLRETHKGAPTLAQGLIAEAEKSKDEDVRAVMKRVQRDLDALQSADEREKQGGHVALTPAQAAVAIESWAALDAGYSVLEICLRDAGVPYDEVLANQPKVKNNPLRRAVSRVPPSEKPVRGRPKNSAGKKKVVPAPEKPPEVISKA